MYAMNFRKNYSIVFFLFSILIVLTLFSACRAKKIIPSPGKGMEKVTVDPVKMQRDVILKSISDQRFNFNFLSAKAKVDIETSDKKKFNLTFNLRMQNNKTIWVSITAIAGIEVARILMTTDSIKVIDRINNRYLRNDFNYISELLNAKVDFLTVQDILTGNFPESLKNDDMKFREEPGEYLFSGLKDSIDLRMLVGKSNVKMNRLEIVNQNVVQRLSADYSNFQSVNNQLFPFLLNIFSKSGRNEVKLRADFTRVQIEEALQFPFSIPKRFN